MKTVIMAGGKGTRISSIAPDIPKPMIKIGGKPVLEQELICLRDQGFDDVIITLSYKADQITDFFKNGDRLGMRISYFVEEQPLGNAGALFKIRDQLTDDFLLLNADTVFDVDFNRFAEYHKRKGGLATLFTHPNSHPYDSGLIIADEDGVIQKWLTKEDVRPQWYRNRVNAGLHIINPKALDLSGVDQGRVDLDRQILKPLCGKGNIYCYDSPEYVRDMGTPERYEAVCRDYQNGTVQAKNLKNKQKAIFLDRDGTINKYVDFLHKIEDFELLPGVSEAIKKINASGYLAVVVTNQPVVARGELTEEELKLIHDKMETLLGEQGAYLDRIYYCPHHPQSGFPGEIPELKISCECRKPKPGMLLKAAQELNIDLSQSWMIGDGEHDIKAGKAAGCKTALIGENNFYQEMTVNSLLQFTDILLKQ